MANTQCISDEHGSAHEWTTYPEMAHGVIVYVRECVRCGRTVVLGA